MVVVAEMMAGQMAMQTSPLVDLMRRRLMEESLRQAQQAQTGATGEGVVSIQPYGGVTPVSGSAFAAPQYSTTAQMAPRFSPASVPTAPSAYPGSQYLPQRSTPLDSPLLRELQQAKLGYMQRNPGMRRPAMPGAGRNAIQPSYTSPLDRTIQPVTY